MSPTQKKILVGIDGSDQSLGAARYAGEILSKQNIEIVLFHALRTLDESFWDVKMRPMLREDLDYAREWTARYRKNAEEFMEHARQILIEAGIPQDLITVKIVKSKMGTAREIAFESAKDYSAVVVGRKGLSRLKDLVMGNVAHKLVAQMGLPVPVWVIGKAPDTHKILLALDGSDISLKIADYVGEMLAGADVTILLLHVVKTEYYISGGEVISLQQAEMLETITEEIKPVFKEAKNRLINAGIDAGQIRIKLMSEAVSHAGGIIKEAKEGNYGTIVVGRKGHSKVEEFFLGRVSNKVVQLAKDRAVWVIS